MHALQLASETPSALLDWNNNYGADPNKAVCFHCSNLPKHFFRDVKMDYQAIIAGTVGKENTLGTCTGLVKSGAMCFARFHRRCPRHHTWLFRQRPFHPYFLPTTLSVSLLTLTCTERHGVDDGVAALLGAQGAAGGVFELPGAVGIDLFRLMIAITPAPVYMSQRPEWFPVPLWALRLRLPIHRRSSSTISAQCIACHMPAALFPR